MSSFILYSCLILKLDLFLFYFMYLCFVCVYVCIPCVCLVPKEASTPPTTDGSESPGGCWDLNSRPLPEQHRLLTTEPFLLVFVCLLVFTQARVYGSHGQIFK